jgi:hypothetical protein
MGQTLMCPLTSMQNVTARVSSSNGPLTYVAAWCYHWRVPRREEGGIVVWRRFYRRSFIAVLILGAMGIVSSAVASHPAVAAQPTGMSVGYAGPAQDRSESPLSNAASQQFTSRNWDGYITYSSSESTDFSSVQASWIQPTVTCEKSHAWTVFWVGLDGWFNNTVEQGGSEAYCENAQDAPSYYLWWEMYPTVPIQTDMQINAGDQVTASVTYKTKSDNFVIDVTDSTSGASLSETEQCAENLDCQRSSADVITEDVGKYGSGKYYPLADYGKMGYTSAAVGDAAGDTGSISASFWLNAAVTEEDDNTLYAKVTPLSNDGSAFRSTWKHE